jgi:hypothetical protein
MYSIYSLKTERTTGPETSSSSNSANGIEMMLYCILDSLFKLLNVIRIDNSPENGSMNRM